MSRKAFLSAVLTLLIVFGGLPLIESLQVKEWNAYAVSSGDDWPMFLHDPAHTGGSTGSGPMKPVVLWNYTESGSACVVVNGVVYAGGFSDGFRSANIIAFDAYTGAKIWNYSASYLQTSPAVYGDTLIIGIDHSVYAFDALTGTKIWNYTTAARVAGEPTITDGTVYVGSGNTYQYISNGLVEVGLSDCNVYAINASTGTKIWSSKTDDIPSSPAVSVVNQSFSMIFVRVGNHFVYALSSLDGTKIWSHNVGSVIGTSIAVGEGKVFGCCWREFIWALDAQTGVEKWRFNGPGGVQDTSPAVVSGVVYVGGHNGRVYALNASTGNKIWEYETGKPNLWGTAVAGGVVYTGSESGKLFAVNASTGTLIWVFNATSTIYSPVVANGILYFGEQSGFYAIGEHTSNSEQTSNIEFLTVPVVVVSVAVVILVSAGLLVYFKKRKR